MNDSKRELRHGEKCPCGSGKKYGHCCKKKDFQWVKDSSGKIYRQLPVHPVHPFLHGIVEEQCEQFKKVYGREPTPNDPFIPPTFSDKEYEEAVVEALIKSGASPEYVYAFLKTGLLLTEFNMNLIPDKDIQEWNKACREFKKLVKQQPQTEASPDDWSTKVDVLFEEVEACKIFFRQIIQTHGVALNIKTKNKVNAALHDFIFLCVTKSLKSFEAVDRLIEANHGEDALILIRSIYEAYLTINFLINHPEKINSFVFAEVGRKAGVCEYIRDNKGKRMIVDKKSGAQFDVYSTAKMAKLSPCKEDIQIYNFFYSYLSEFSHPNIWALESYLDGHKFDPAGRSKVVQAGIYAIFCACLVLDTMVSFTGLENQFRDDLRVFLKRSRDKLMLVFEGMKDHDDSVPKTFKQRSSYLGSRPSEDKSSQAA